MKDEAYRIGESNYKVTVPSVQTTVVKPALLCQLSPLVIAAHCTVVPANRKSVKAVQLSKAFESILVRVAGKMMLVRALQLKNAELPIFVSCWVPEAKVTLVSESQFSKALLLITFTVLGKTIEVKAEFLKSRYPISVMLEGIVTEVSEVQPSKGPSSLNAVEPILPQPVKSRDERALQYPKA